MSKIIKEFLLEEQSGTVNIEFEDNSTISFNLADAVPGTVTLSAFRWNVA